MASAYTPQLDILGPNGQRITENLKAVTGGGFDIKWFAPGALLPALEIFDTEELVQIFSICGLASLVQRFSAIRPYKTSADVAALAVRFNLPTDRLVARYPLPDDGGERKDG